jgi:transcriptional regulator of arginine metabolism
VTAHRRERQGAILRLIRERPISTQSELADALREAGHEAVQTTVSRDIADLGLVKVRAPSGRLVYAPPGATDADRLHEMIVAMRRWALLVECNENLVVLTTPSGHANSLAQAIDEAGHPRVLSTVAGDNTILVIPRMGVPAPMLCEELKSQLLEGAA